MALWLRELAALPKDLSSVPRIYPRQFTPTCDSGYRGMAQSVKHLLVYNLGLESDLSTI